MMIKVKKKKKKKKKTRAELYFKTKILRNLHKEDLNN